MSKRMQEARKKIQGQGPVSLEEAVRTVQALPAAKFDESVELAASLNVDAKKGEQNVRGTVQLPHGSGKTKRVIVFCKGEAETAAREAGADHVGSADLIKKVSEGWMDFDVVVATPDMMRDVSKLGRVLGPRGMMPNPKIGTVTPDVGRAVKEVKQGRVAFKMDKLGNVHLMIGKRSFDAEKLTENGRAAVEAIVQAKPATAKGKLIRRLVISSTMSPGVHVSTSGLEIVKGE